MRKITNYYEYQLVPNVLLVIGMNEEELTHFRNTAKGVRSLDFNKFTPYPADSEPDPCWCKENWGAFENAESVKIKSTKGRIMYSFKTCLDPPLRVTLTMSKMFPNLEFVLLFCDPSNGNGWMGKFRCLGGDWIQHIQVEKATPGRVIESDLLALESL